MLVPSLFSPNLKETIDYYVSRLGFEQTGAFEDGDKVIWAELTFRDPKADSRIWFFSNAIEDRPAPCMSGVIYVFVEDVDAVAKKLATHVPFR